MCGVDVAERRALVQDVVPRKREVAGELRFRTVFEKKVGDEPCVVMKFARVERSIMGKTLNYVWCRKNGRGVNHLFTVKATNLPVSETDHVGTLFIRHD